MANRRNVSVRVLWRLLDCDFETGELRWKERPVWMFRPNANGRAAAQKAWNTRYSGRVAFTSKRGDYYYSRIFGSKPVYAHHVVYAMHNGQWAEDQIDHINGNPEDNRICNLRPVTAEQNMRNKKMYTNNRSGAVGVSFDGSHQVWVAYVNHRGRQLKLGRFKNRQAAVSARKAAEVDMPYHPNHGRAVAQKR